MTERKLINKLWYKPWERFEAGHLMGGTPFDVETTIPLRKSIDEKGNFFYTIELPNTQ